MDSQYETVAEAARRYLVSPATIRKWVKKGKLGGIQPGGKHGVVLVCKG